MWDDSDSAHRALKGLGRQPVAMRESFIDDQDAMPVDSSVTEWRLGQPHAKARQLLLRHATTADKKLLGAAQQSQYYYKYGNPNAVHHKAAQNKTQQSDLRYVKQYCSTYCTCTLLETRKQEHTYSVYVPYSRKI